jgi:hypothetical protein
MTDNRLRQSHAGYRQQRNFIINGALDFDQRNASSVASPVAGTGSQTRDYFMDRWAQAHDESATSYQINRAAFTPGQTQVPGEPRYYGHFEINSTGSGGTFLRIDQRIESARTLAGRVCSFSGWLRSDADRTVTLSMIQDFGTGGSPSSDVTVGSISLSVTTTWKRFTASFVVPSISGKTFGTNNDDFLELRFALPVNTDLEFDWANISVVEGERPIEYAEIVRSFKEELELCQRYFEKSYNLEVVPQTITNVGVYMSHTSNTGNYGDSLDFKVRKRTNPTATAYNPTTGTSGEFRVGGSNVAGTFIDISETGLSKNDTGVVGNSIVRAHWTAEAEL